MNPVTTVTLPNGCGCSCDGVRCGRVTETSEIRYDMTTKRQCCNACGMQQRKAHYFLFGAGGAASEVATRSVCWLSQCEDVRLHGIAPVHQGNNHAAADSENEE
jgi:hypothetical protein